MEPTKHSYLEASEELQLAENSYKSLHKLINSGSWKMYCDTSSRIVQVEWSDDLRRMIGYNNETDFPNLFSAWSDLLHPDDYQRVLSEIAPVLEDTSGEKIFSQDYRLNTKDRGYRWFRASGDVSRRKDGSAYCFFGVFIDITKEKEHNELAKEREVALKKANDALLWRDTLSDIITQNLGSVYVILNKANRDSVYVSPSIEDVFGISKEDPHPLLSIQKLESNVSKDFSVPDIINLPAGHSIVQDCWITPVGGSAPKMFQKTAYHVVKEQKDLLIFEFADHTHEQAIRKSIQDALEIAKSANAAKSSFLSNMSHDIRTPMNVIVGLTELMEHELHNPDKLYEYLQKIKISSRHLLGLINDILDMSKIESGKTMLNIGAFNLIDQIKEIETLIRPQTQEHEQHFEIHTENLVHKNVEGDALRIRQIFINILSNAVKYTPDAGSITFTISEMDCPSESCAKYKFVVSDNGIGMKEEYLKRIFEPFTRQENSVTNRIQGTGLGMAITKNIVDMMGGIIRVSSTEGKGSTFEVILELRIHNTTDSDREIPLPPLHTQSSKTQPVEVSADTNPLRGLHFLCAEDNALNAEILEAVLRLEDASCEICSNGKEIVEKFNHAQTGDYDAILMDIQMPIMNGYDATKAIRSGANPLGATIPIIAMTANAFADDIQQSLDAGMNGHISKPMDIQVLKKTIEGLIK